MSTQTHRELLYARAQAHVPHARWYVRVAGIAVEVRRLTRPHRTRSLVLVSSTAHPAHAWHVEARDLIRS